MKFFNRLKAATTIVFLVLVLTGCTTLGQQRTPETVINDNTEMEQIGTVTADNTSWNWLFRLDAAERTAVLEKLAQQKAADIYGGDQDELIVITENIEGKWSPASLLMLFDSLGFVEKASIEASVWRVIPKPGPEDPVKYGYRYVVIPEANYTNEKGFMNVEYKTREQLELDLEESFNTCETDSITMNKRLSKLPDTGKVFITLGREEITNAISRWFTFTCTHNGKTVFRKRGIEDIPYVYGTDKLWWNDMSYNINQGWEGELELTIEDSYRNEKYNFRILKEKYIMED